MAGMIEALATSIELNRGDEDTKTESPPRNTQEITQLFSTIIETLNDPKLDGKKEKIMEWIQTNEARIHELDRKVFINEICAYCDNDKKIKGVLGKIYKQYTNYKPAQDDNHNTQIADQSETATTVVPTEVKQSTQIFSDIIDSIHDPKLEGKKEKIMEWIQTNEARIHELDRKVFINEICAYCDNDKKIKGVLGKIYKQYTNYKPAQDDNHNTQIADQSETTTTVVPTEVKQSTQIFSDIIDSIHDPKLEGKKEKIMEWIQTNETRIPQLDRKGFMNEISNYSDDKKIKGALGKIWKQYHIELMQYSVSQPEPVPNTSITTDTDSK
eukprot:144866_1